MPRARRQVTYETPYLQGPVRSESPAEPEEITSKPPSLKPSHAGQFIPRARRQVTYETPHLQGAVRSASLAESEKNTSERFSNCLIFSNRLTPDCSCSVRAAMSPTKLPTCKVLYAVHHLQNLRKLRASRIVSNRLTPDSSCPVRAAMSPTKLPTCKVLYAVHHLQNLRKIRASDSQTVSYSQTVSPRTVHAPCAPPCHLRNSLPARSCTQRVACGT